MPIQTKLGNKPAWLQLIVFGGLIGLILFLISGLGLTLIARANDLGVRQIAAMQPEDYTRPELAGVVKGLLLMQSLGLFILPSLFFAVLADPRPMAYIGLKKPDKRAFVYIGILTMIAAFFMVQWLGLVNETLVNHFLSKSARQWVEKGETETDNTLKNILTMKNPTDLLVSLLLAGVLAAFGEELFFRGVLQRIFIRAFRSPWPGIIFTAALFSAFHGQFMGFLPRMILGIILGALYWYSGSLIPAMIGHFIFNSGQLLLIYFKVTDLDSKSGTDTLTTVVGIVSLGVVIFLMNYLRRRSETTYEKMYPPVMEDTPFDDHPS
jgi:hypothetical protein